MKKVWFCWLIALAGISGLNSGVFAQSLYDINTIQTIEIRFSHGNWDYMLDTSKAGSDGYIMAQSVTINGTQYDSVGVKYKGNSTYSPNQVKNPFHIELDTYKDQDYQGYKDIKLSNAAKDPSFLREVLSYSILRQYMDAPLSNYANVYVNGVLIGLYVSSESVSKTFVNSHFYSKDKAFFKCNPIDGAEPGSSSSIPNLVYLGTDSALYANAYEIKSDAGWKDLIGLCSTLQNNTAEIETVLDVDRALWMIAFDNVLVNLDSYIGQFAQNYYLYKDDAGRFNCVLWDFNESFGTFSMSGTINFSSTASKSQMTHLLHSGDAKWPLVQKLLAVPTYKKMYLAHMQTILTENFSNGSYLTIAQSLQPVINAAVQADPNKFFNYAQYQSNLTADVTSGPGGPGNSSAPGIKNLMTGRNTYLSALADFKNTKPTITNVVSSDTSPKLNSMTFITANVANANSVYLGVRYGKADKFSRVIMFDDGAHGDGSSGDNIYGTLINIDNKLVQYYIYAENSNAGMFSPARAEHEFYTLMAVADPGSDIVMNEIYARGTTADPDWIEIYNSSSAAVDISGYKIYDGNGQSGAKAKKEFPAGTIVPAKGYYVIVTDDSAPSAFGLSSDGEKVWLENASGAIVDSTIFLGHSAMQSCGRIPDGGLWQLLNTITRGISNGSATGIRDESYVAKNFKLSQNYPNPFNSTTTISFAVPLQATVSLKIFDVSGKEVAILLDDELPAGTYERQWNATALASGVYFYRLQAGQFRETRTLLLLK